MTQQEADNTVAGDIGIWGILSFIYDNQSTQLFLKLDTLHGNPYLLSIPLCVAVGRGMIDALLTNGSVIS